MITYNHELYISQAIEGVLMQKVNFRYQIVLGEYCSTDRTREITLEYPEKFTLISHCKSSRATPLIERDLHQHKIYTGIPTQKTKI
ncbi:MAG: hypothetical protein Q8928_07225 [Bacteroidota bacterium]|nr:hypothetical protein [Bacteroidota bacterium]